MSQQMRRRELIRIVGAGAGALTLAQEVKAENETSEFDITTINGQIAVEDEILPVQGEVPPNLDTAVIVIGNDGFVEFHRPSNDKFSTKLSTTSLSTGTAITHLISSAEDGVLGDGQNPRLIGANSTDSLFAFIAGLDDNLSQNEVNRKIIEQTINDTGSDDFAISETFRITSALTVITEVIPETRDVSESSGVGEISVGERVVVTGRTNRLPDRNSISVSLIDPSSDEVLAEQQTEQWDTDGEWQTDIRVPNATNAGRYALRVSDGDSRDTTELSVVASRSGLTSTPAATPIPTQKSTPTPTLTPTPTAMTGTPTSQPGGQIGGLATLAALGFISVGGVGVWWWSQNAGADDTESEIDETLPDIPDGTGGESGDGEETLMSSPSPSEPESDPDPSSHSESDSESFDQKSSSSTGGQVSSDSDTDRNTQTSHQARGHNHLQTLKRILTSTESETTQGETGREEEQTKD
ncbi:probable secreted glycoprotein (plasmid) [Haloquadratum walsbyi DSM 16790]|uniref:Probable secreted glycoprotein n=2 Tax=Haloquadratum walsbyi TaxID=293091 RepID=Q18DD5_HALWD|nr:probable secreted glycoprotein [Haloquadratum walsbyi DSM 16790]